MSWYLMHRGWQEDPVFDDEPYTQREAWEWLISKASYDGTQKFNIKGHVCCLPAGRLSYSFSYMAKAWGWSKAKVKRYVDRLDDANMVETMTERGQIVITICKYEKFQLKDKKAETITDEKRNDERNASETKYKEKEVKEVKNIRNNNNNRGAIDKGRLPMDIPPHWLNWSIEEKQWDKPTTLIVWKEFQGYWNRQIGHNALLTIEEWETKWKAYCLKQNIKPTNKTTKSESKPHGKYRTQF